MLLLNGLDKEPPQQVFFFLTKNAFVRLKRTGKWNFSIWFISLVDVKTWLKCWRVFSSIVAGQSQVFCGLGMNWEKCLPYINVDLSYQLKMKHGGRNKRNCWSLSRIYAMAKMDKESPTTKLLAWDYFLNLVVDDLD